MRRSTPIVICCALILLFRVAEAIASGTAGALPVPPPLGSKITGPTVKGTILIGGSRSDAPGMFAIRLTKGNLSSGAIVCSARVHQSLGTLLDTTPDHIAHLFLGGSMTPGGLLRPYFVGLDDCNEPNSSRLDNTSVLIEIFHELGIAISLDQDPLYQPVIVDVDDAVCSPPPEDRSPVCTGTLSLDVKIKFAFPKKR